MKSIISLLLLFFVCSALASDIEASLAKKPLKCETRQEYASCYFHCLFKGFKKASCKDKLCECVDRFKQSGDEEPEEVAAVDLQTDLKCTTPREFYQCYKHCKDTGYYVPYCKSKKCACHGSRSNSIKPFDDAELAPNSQALCIVAICSYTCKQSGFQLGVCASQVCKCLK